MGKQNPPADMPGPFPPPPIAKRKGLGNEVGVEEMALQSCLANNESKLQQTQVTMNFDASSNITKFSNCTDDASALNEVPLENLHGHTVLDRSDEIEEKEEIH